LDRHPIRGELEDTATTYSTPTSSG
jgi:hypothetical protein